MEQGLHQVLRGEKGGRTLWGSSQALQSVGPWFKLQSQQQLTTVYQLCALGESLNLSEPHFPHQRNGCNSSYFLGSYEN